MPHILGLTYDGVRHALPLVQLSPNVAESLLLEADCVFPVEEADCHALGKGWEAEASESDSDYLFDAHSLSFLDGRALKPKRQQARQYLNDGEPEMLIGTSNFMSWALALLEDWQSSCGRAPAETDYDSCKEAICLSTNLGLEQVMMFRRDRADGFLLAARLADGSKAVHFAKARRDIVGAYPVLFSEYAKVAKVRQLNFEQDLGRAGFRQAKLALGPKKKLKKFRLRRSNTNHA